MKLKYIYTLIILIIFTPVLTQANKKADDSYSYIGVKYIRGGIYGMNIAYTSETMYTFINTLNTTIIDDNDSDAPNYSVIPLLNQHFGAFLYQNIGIGIVWGLSKSTFPVREDLNNWSFGFETPILIEKIENVPIYILPFWEKMGKENSRFGSNFMLLVQHPFPFKFTIEAAVYKTYFKFEDRITVGSDISYLKSNESEWAADFSVGVGFGG